MRTMTWSAMAVLAVVGVGRAEEPHLELIRGLRAQGEPELAREYIEERLSKQTAPALAQILRLELARTRVEIARQENEEGKRLALFAAARAEFDNFLRTNPTHALAPQARFEIARLIASQGKEAVNRARRADGEKRVQALKDARPLFEAAVKQLADAGKQLKTQLDGVRDPKTPEERTTNRDLTQSWLQAQLEEGMNLYLLAQTYAASEPAVVAEVKKRASLLSDAAKVFERLMNLGDHQRLPIVWLGRAWLARCYFENDDFGKANEQFDVIQAERGPQVDDAKRVAAYFRLLMQRKQGADVAKQLALLQGWYEKYRAYAKSPEGCGVRYFLADILEIQAEAGVKRDSKGRPTEVSADATIKLKEAERHLRALTEFENDFTDRAANKRIRIILAITIRESKDRDPAKLNDFERCYLLALVEVAELNEALKEPEVAEDPEKFKAVREKHYEKVIRALARGLRMVKPTDSPKEVQDAKVMQVYAYFVLGYHHQAAILGEHLAKQMMRQSRGAVPALYALQAYRNVMLETKARGTAREAELKTDHDQIVRLATFMESTWPNDSPTDSARHTLGSLYFADGNYVKALETFARVTPNYASLANLRNEQGVACFNLQRDAKVPLPVRRDWFARITALLDNMPDLGAGADAETGYHYCLARLQLANLLLFEGKQYDRVEQIGKQVLDQHVKYGLGEKAAEIQFSAFAIKTYGLQGRVYDLVKANRHGDAAALYEPALAAIDKMTFPDDQIGARAKTAASAILQLAMRSSVQDGQIERAQGILKLMEKTNAGSADASGPLVQVLRELQSQINDMRRHDPNRLKDTVEKIAGFLEALAKQPNLSREVKIFLAQGFCSLDKPARGVELLASIPTPDVKDPAPLPKAPPENASDDDKQKYEVAKVENEKARAAYDAAWKPFWFAQLTHVRALRQAARMEPDKAKQLALFKNADAMLDQMIGTPQKHGWAFNSLEVRRERIFVLEDREQWQPAFQSWLAMRKPFERQFENPPKDEKQVRMRSAYFEINFYVMRIVYKSKLKIKDQAKKETDVRRLADQIVDIEKDARTADFGGPNVKKLYLEFIEDEELMRKHYTAAGGKALLPSGDAAGGQQ